jgi:PAS domain S-box-containing protein
MKWSITVKTTAAGAITLLLLATFGLTALFQARESRDISNWIAHSHEVLSVLKSVKALSGDCEDETRFYAETADTQFLNEYRVHSTELATRYNDLIKLVSDNKEQSRRAKKLAELCEAEIRQCDIVTGFHGVQSAPEKSDISTIQEMVNQVEDMVAESEAEEKHLLSKRSQIFLEAGRYILFSQVALICLSVVVLVVAYVLLLRHVQDQQRSEALLKSSKLRFTGIFNQAFQQVWLLSNEGNLLQANQTALDFVGLTRETEVGRPFWETAWWQNQAANQERFKIALASAVKGNLERFELETTNAAGNSVILDFSLKPLAAEDNKVGLLIAEGRDITDSKIAQLTLKENQIRLNAIVQSLAEGLYQVDTDGRLFYINPTGAKMLGYEIEELNGELMHEKVHGPSGPADKCHILDVIKKGDSQNREDAYRRKDGSMMPVQLFSAPLILDGEIKGAVVSFYDITLRKEAQARFNMQYALTNMLSQADSLADASGLLLQQVCEQINWIAGAFWLVDQEGQHLQLISSWNDPQIALDSEIGKLSQINLEPGEDIPGTVWKSNAPLWVGKGSRSDSALLSKVASLGLNTVFALPVRSDELVLGVIAFISKDAAELSSTQLQMLNAIGSQFGQFIERQQAEERLRDREMLFQNLVTNIREIFWISSARPGDNKVLYVSPAFEEVWGTPVSEVYKRANSYLDAVVPEDIPRVKQHVLKDMYSGSAIEFRIKRPDGTIRWVWGRWSAVMGVDGKPDRLVGIVHDISERKEMERRVSEFYSTVSHELRTPLTSIRASLGLLEGGLAGALSAKATKLVDIARSECDRLIRLINDILDIRKIEAGKLELRISHVSVKKIVDLTIQGTAGMALECGVKLVSMVTTEREIRADQDRLIQVLTNLVSNALKFSPRDADVTVQVEDEGSFCRFSVTDKGPGIPEDQLSKLFGLFQQLDSTDSRPKGGTGLGLAISKAIVEQHGGVVGVDTQPGRGSTFYFDVPTTSVRLRKVNAGENGTAEHGIEGRVSDTVASSTACDAPRILLVEDDEKLAEVLKELLESEKYSLDIARTIEEADILMRNGNHVAVVLDVHLPDGNGLEWMRRTREAKLMENVPVVVLTGQDKDHSYGGPLLIDWLRKPVDIESLLKALKTATVQHSSATPRPQVLIVEDDSSTREIIVHQLKEIGISALEAMSGTMALEMVQSCKPDLIILDLGLPLLDGFELVHNLEQGDLHSTPLLVYTSRDLSGVEMDELKLGLTKHLIKSKTSQAEFLSAVKELLSNVLAPHSTLVDAGLG